MSFEQSPSNHLPVNNALKCAEEWVSPESNADNFEDVEPFRFVVTLPSTLSANGVNKRLTFYSRERSSGTGVLTSDDDTTELETIHDGPLDPHFFERGFYLEAKTGFQVWPGSRLLLQALLCDLGGDSIGFPFGRLKYWQDRLLRSSTPLNILEVGAGIGVVGGSLAAAGGHVLMSDLNVLVNYGMGPNLLRNGSELASDNNISSPFLTSTLPPEQCEETYTRPISIGSGYARPTVLDWFKPVSKQLSFDTYSNVDLIVACDCIFLRKIVDPLFNTVEEIFCNTDNKSEEVTCLFTYQKRNLMGVFIPLEEVLDMIDQRGWSVRCLAWRKVLVEDDGEHDLYLFEISGRKDALCRGIAAAGDKKE
jgi:hypothetical protein